MIPSKRWFFLAVGIFLGSLQISDCSNLLEGESRRSPERLYSFNQQPQEEPPPHYNSPGGGENMGFMREQSFPTFQQIQSHFNQENDPPLEAHPSHHRDEWERPFRHRAPSHHPHLHHQRHLQQGTFDHPPNRHNHRHQRQPEEEHGAYSHSYFEGPFSTQVTLDTPHRFRHHIRHTPPRHPPPHSHKHTRPIIMNYHHPYENEIDEKPPHHHTHSSPHHEQFQLQSHFKHPHSTNQQPKKKKMYGRPPPITILSLGHSHVHSLPHQTQQFPSDPPQNFDFHELSHPHESHNHNQHESNLIESPQPKEKPMKIDPYHNSIPNSYAPPSHTQDQPRPSFHPQQQAQGPIVLKLSGILKGKEQVEYQPPAKFPDGPPVFYAPSPDVQMRQRKKQQAEAQRHNSQGVAAQNLHKKKRRNNKTSDETSVTTHEREEQPESRRRRRSVSVDPMIADGSETEAFWSSPYIRFDSYKKLEDENSREGGVAQGRSSSSNVTFHDSNSEEQRFFPSFPSPYLGGLGPFGGGALNALASPARAPLFPGPAANSNRAPSSRFHPSSPFKFSAAPLANRGPSSASASHHDRYHDNNLLGSGNFEVVRGGTYYGDDDEGPAYNHGGSLYHNGGDDDEGYYGQNNGHSSPYRGGGDLFANFRDFADINPHSRSYSQQHPTHLSPPHQPPSNIYDKLEEEREEETLETASSGDNHQPQFSLEYDPMMATY